MIKYKKLLSKIDILKIRINIINNLDNENKIKMIEKINKKDISIIMSNKILLKKILHLKEINENFWSYRANNFKDHYVDLIIDFFEKINYKLTMQDFFNYMTIENIDNMNKTIKNKEMVLFLNTTPGYTVNNNNSSNEQFDYLKMQLVLVKEIKKQNINDLIKKQEIINKIINF